MPDFIGLFPWLTDGLLSHASFNILMLMGIPLVGYHAMERAGDKSDFDKKIKKLEGFLEIHPMVIAHWNEPVKNT